MSSGHALPLRMYFAVFGTLLFLTWFTWWIATVDLGGWNTAIALSVAMTKVVLVVLYFMHVKYSSKLVWVFAAAGAYWLTIFFVFLMSDYLTRNPVTGWGA